MSTSSSNAFAGYPFDNRKQIANLIVAITDSHPLLMDFGCGVRAKQQYKAAAEQWKVQVHAIADGCFYGDDKRKFLLRLETLQPNSLDYYGVAAATAKVKP